MSYPHPHPHPTLPSSYQALQAEVSNGFASLRTVDSKICEYQQKVNVEFVAQELFGYFDLETKNAEEYADAVMKDQLALARTYGEQIKILNKNISDIVPKFAPAAKKAFSSLDGQISKIKSDMKTMQSWAIAVGVFNTISEITSVVCGFAGGMPKCGAEERRRRRRLAGEPEDEPEPEPEPGSNSPSGGGCIGDFIKQAKNVRDLFKDIDKWSQKSTWADPSECFVL